MDLVIGGAFQGKLTWALAHYGFSMADVCDLAVSEPRAGAKCYCHLPLFENAVVVCREVSGGIVPMDGEERAWRERHGTLMQDMARGADRVTRVFCGLAEVLK